MSRHSTHSGIPAVSYRKERTIPGRVEVPVNPELFGLIGSESRWSDAVVVNDFIFVTGQLGWDKQTGEFVDGIEAQTERSGP
jgi:enamine deaminase RidA (YjgF/YER057c/UK114 family)